MREPSSQHALSMTQNDRLSTEIHFLHLRTLAGISLRIPWAIRVQEHHQALQEVRVRQKDAPFWETYRSRSGIEGTISQGVRAFGMRRSRYRGMQKTHFQHLMCATCINLVRALAWLEGQPLAQTRTSRFAALALVA